MWPHQRRGPRIPIRAWLSWGLFVLVRCLHLRASGACLLTRAPPINCESIPLPALCDCQPASFGTFNGPIMATRARTSHAVSVAHLLAKLFLCNTSTPMCKPTSLGRSWSNTGLLLLQEARMRLSSSFTRAQIFRSYQPSGGAGACYLQPIGPSYPF